MSRLLATALTGLLLAIASSAGPLGSVLAASGSGGEEGNPVNDQGSSFHYRSEITGVTPSVPGLNVQVLEFADRLLLTNHTGKTVTIYGYSNEPYARVLANGAAEQNSRSPATYLNTSFYGDVNPPASANAKAQPHWVLVDRTGQFEWHDHRIHYTSPATPPQVKDKGRRTLIFDWRVPIRVGAQAGAISGKLFWAPESSNVSVAVIVLGVAILVLGLLLVVVVRRRRTRLGGADGDGGAGGGAADGRRAGAGGDRDGGDTGAGAETSPRRKEAW